MTLECMSTIELIQNINREDQTVALAVSKAADAVCKLVDAIYESMKEGGRLFYIGAGTSGRLGIVDASECPPTFGVDHGVVVGLTLEATVRSERLWNLLRTILTKHGKIFRNIILIRRIVL